MTRVSVYVRGGREMGGGGGGATDSYIYLVFCSVFVLHCLL